MIKISIIVPVYRAEKYLNRCVDSILSQTYTALEVILVDDGSPDQSGAMCDGYAKKDSETAQTTTLTGRWILYYCYLSIMQWETC